MTQIIANNMVQSRRISPHVHSYFEVDYTRLDRIRGKSRKLWEEQGVKVSYTAFIARAVATALREHGQTAKYYHEYEGLTARLDTIQAAVLMRTAGRPLPSSMVRGS